MAINNRWIGKHAFVGSYVFLIFQQDLSYIRFRLLVLMRRQYIESCYSRQLIRFVLDRFNTLGSYESTYLRLCESTVCKKVSSKTF